MKSKNISVSFFLFSFLTGCAATTETDPSKVNWMDLTFKKDRLDAHLDSRRNELARLQSQARELENRLKKKDLELDTVNEKLQSAKAQSATQQRELDALNDDIKEKQNELSSLQAKLVQLQTEHSNLMSNLESLNQNKREVDAKIMRSETEIEQLQDEVAVLERAIDRILLVRAKHALENS